MKRLAPEDSPTPLLAPHERPAVQIEEPRTGRFRGLTCAFRLLSLAAKLAGLFVVRKFSAERAGSEVRILLEDFGGMWIKLGQFVSLRHDLYPIEFCRQLMRIQDRASGFPGAIARRIVEEDLGCPIEEVFSEFEETPIAAASIAQVHRGRLRRPDCRVVIKVQRPDIFHTYLVDMRLIRLAVRCMSIVPTLGNLGLADFEIEFARMFEEELDYRREADHIRVMRRILKAHKVYAPKTWKRYNRGRVLVMEYIDGVFMSDYLKIVQQDPRRVDAWLRENDIDPKEVARKLHHTYLRQMLEEPYFHSDLHPGNIALLARGRIALIDFGAVGILYNDFRRPLILYLHALASRNLNAAIDRLMRFFEPIPPIDLDTLKRDLLEALRRWDANARIESLPYAERSHLQLYQALGAVSFKYRMSLDWTFLRADRANYTIQSSLTNLCPDFRLQEAMMGYFRSAMKRQGKKAKKVSGRDRLSSIQNVLREAEHQVTLAKGDMETAVQNSSLGFAATTSKIAFAAGAFLGQVRWLIFLATLAFAFVFYDQRWGPIDVSPTSAQAAAWLSGLPRLGDLDFLAGGLLMVYLNQMLSLMAGRLACK